MAIPLTTITAAIAALSISGVTVKDVDEIAKSVTQRDCPVLYPRPDGFVSQFNVTRDSFGSDAQAKKTATFVLTYRFLHSEIAADRATLFSTYDDMAAAVFTVLDTFIANSTLDGLVDLQVLDTPSWGPVSDPAGKMFHGTDISLLVSVFIN